MALFWQNNFDQGTLIFTNKMRIFCWGHVDTPPSTFSKNKLLIIFVSHTSYLDTYLWLFESGNLIKDMTNYNVLFLHNEWRLCLACSIWLSIPETKRHPFIYFAKYYFIIITGILLSCKTLWDTLPNNAVLTFPWPLLPITITSKLFFSP